MTQFDLYRANARRRAAETADATILVWKRGTRAVCVTVPEVLDAWTRLDSKGGELKARVNVNPKERAKLIDRCKPLDLGDWDALDAEWQERYYQLKGKKPTRKNDGYLAEYAVFKSFGKAAEWEPDSVPFYVAPDITFNGRGYQIKEATSATFWTESNLRELDKRGL